MVAHGKTPLTAFTGQLHSAAGSLHDGIAVAHHQTDATGHVEMVQRNRIRGFFIVRSDDDQDVSAFGCAKGPTRAWQPVRALPFRSLWDGSHALASVQPCLARCLLAVFLQDYLPACHCYGTVFPDDSPAA